MKLSPAQVYVAVLTAVTLIVGAAHMAPTLRPVHETGLPPLSATLQGLPTAAQRPHVLGYEREEFGAGWGTLGACSTRDAVMAAAFASVGCSSSGVARDVYTGREMSADDVQVDHIFPLSAAWDMGAHGWDASERVAFANDPANLVAVSSEVNQDKSDQLPAEWLPPDPAARCWYVRRLAVVARTYALPLSDGDVRAMRRQCRVGEWLGIN